MTKQIPLSRGLFATVDDEDYEYLIQWKWSALKTEKAGRVRFYACRMQRKGEFVDKPKMMLMHRVVSGAVYGQITDHHDRDGLNNTRLNLRPTTQANNCLNNVSHQDSFSRFKGVWWHKKNRKWIAEFRGKHIGCFPSEEVAAAAYDDKAKAYSSEYALTNADGGGK